MEISTLRKGDTAIVMGNGQSLKEMPPRLLDKYESFGVNHINLCGIVPTYLICIDSKALVDRADMIIEVASKAKIAFLSSYHNGSENEASAELYRLPNIELVYKDTNAFSKERYMTGHTGLYVALKMAYYIGFSTVLLFGVDHDAEWKHCSDEYPPGVQTTDAKRKEMRCHLKYADEVYKSSNRKIFNFSKHSLLDDEGIFERTTLDAWLD